MSQLLVCLSVLLLGAEAKINAPETAPVGEFVLVDAADSVGVLTWTVPDPQVSLYVATGGKQIVLYSASPRRVKIRLTAKDEAGTAVETEIIDFAGKTPGPAPAPKPDTPKPMPVEPQPEGRFGIAKPARDKAADVKVESGDQRKTEALLLAAKLTNVRDRIQSGAIKTEDPGTVMQAIRLANAELPRDVQARWHGWGTWWGQTLFGHWKAGKLRASNDWSDVLDETIAGLKGV